MSVNTIVTDIEGTTTSISFVHEVLFPYAARALPDYLRKHAGQHQDILQAVRHESGEASADVERVIRILSDWIATDRKSTPLKTLQGHIWAHGYQSQAFFGHVYEDAVNGLRRWHGQGLRLYVYSSGSVKAQKLLFKHSASGDLTPLFSGYFDTTTGPKREPESYREIVRVINAPAQQILFLSDVKEELDAAIAAGMRTTQLVRDNAVDVGDHTLAKCFDDVAVERSGE